MAGRRAPLRVHFEWPKWTKSHLGALPLRTPLGSEALWRWMNPNRPRGKPILCATASAAAHCPSVESICPRRTGPATGGNFQAAPNPDAVTKEAPWYYTEDISGSGAVSTDNSSYHSVGVGCSSAMQGDLRGVPRGERPRRFFPRFLIGEKSGPAERLYQAGKPESRAWRRSIPPTQLTPGHLPLHKGGFFSLNKYTKPGESNCFLRALLYLTLLPAPRRQCAARPAAWGPRRRGRPS